MLLDWYWHQLIFKAEIMVLYLWKHTAEYVLFHIDWHEDNIWTRITAPNLQASQWKHLLITVLPRNRNFILPKASMETQHVWIITEYVAHQLVLSNTLHFVSLDVCVCLKNGLHLASSQPDWLGASHVLSSTLWWWWCRCRCPVLP